MLTWDYRSTSPLSMAERTAASSGRNRAQSALLTRLCYIRTDENDALPDLPALCCACERRTKAKSTVLSPAPAVCTR